MNDIQSATASGRVLPNLTDFGSPPKLFQLVSELRGIDRQVIRKQGLNYPAISKIRTDIETVCLRHFQYYLGLLSVAGVQRHFLTQVALPQSGNVVLDQIENAIKDERAIAKSSLDVVAVSLQPNYAARIMAGRKAELEGLPYDSDLFDPKDSPVGDGAFEIYRRGALLEAAGNLPEAESMYSLAIQASPRFSLALRGYAKLICRRDPAQAAACYSAALDDMPRLSYGHIDSSFFGTSLESETTYRGFRILVLKDEAIAVPIVVDFIDFSNRALRSRLHRFAGLFLLRIRLRLRRKEGLGAKPGNQAHAPRTNLIAEIKKLLRPYGRPLVPFYRIFVRQVAPIYETFVRQGRRTLARFNAKKSAGYKLVGARLRRVGIWALSLDKQLFDFVLVDTNARRLKAQIDMVHERWLSDDKT